MNLKKKLANVKHCCKKLIINRIKFSFTRQFIPVNRSKSLKLKNIIYVHLDFRSKFKQTFLYIII